MSRRYENRHLGQSHNSDLPWQREHPCLCAIPMVGRGVPTDPHFSNFVLSVPFVVDLAHSIRNT